MNAPASSLGDLGTAPTPESLPCIVHNAPVAALLISSLTADCFNVCSTVNIYNMNHKSSKY